MDELGGGVLGCDCFCFVFFLFFWRVVENVKCFYICCILFLGLLVVGFDDLCDLNLYIKPIYFVKSSDKCPPTYF